MNLTLDVLNDHVTDWLRLDKNPETRSEVLKLQQDGNTEELARRFGQRIEFGTAGLRARMEAGFSRMNDLTVLQASQGLAMYLKSHVVDAQTKGIVIGHDHRYHSESFARLTAAAFITQGFKVWYFKDLVHTPLVPFTINKLGAAGGVMITASHNPKDDNGYKVYWSNACQITPPHDDGIAASILNHLEPWSWDYDLVDKSPLCTDPTDKGVIDDYFKKLTSLSQFKNEQDNTNVKFAYTAMHGVGTPFAIRAFEVFGLSRFIQVEEQVQSDPAFPTVAFPNPEEGKGSLSLAIKTANANGAQIILANDPDADRLAIAEKQRNGEWKIFTGNELGAILGAASFEKAKKAGKKIGNLAMVASTVSSKFLERMAQKEGFRFEESLTGFKWIGNKAMELEKHGYEVIFAFEEAIGFTIGDVVKDKDGISALGFFAEWAVHLYQNNNTVSGYLTDLYEKYGYFVSENSYFICHDKQLIQKIFARIRYGNGAVPGPDSANDPSLNYPKTVGDYKVVSVRDLTIGYDSTTLDKKPILPTSASSEMITFKLENHAVFTIRTSGTEPKIKYYSELCSKSEAAAKASLSKVVNAISDELMESEKNGLERKREEE